MIIKKVLRVNVTEFEVVTKQIQQGVYNLLKNQNNLEIHFAKFPNQSLRGAVCPYAQL